MIKLLQPICLAAVRGFAGPSESDQLKAIEDKDGVNLTDARGAHFY
jgi:hypothetical protein